MGLIVRIRGFILSSFLAIGILLGSSPSYAGLDISLSFDLFSPPPVQLAPPPLPVYVVPAPTNEGYLWSPGYWRWDGGGYFWVPGTWVRPPVVGVLWTPGYWAWRENAFVWNEGYWAPHVGFYGGVNYGGGYDGRGFMGGGWHNGVYNVNRSITNVPNITNVTVMHNASFNGGPGGISATPSPAEQNFARERHIPLTQEQRAHTEQASQMPALKESANHGKPMIAATAKPGDFRHGVVVARQAGAPNPATEQHNLAVRKNPAAMAAAPAASAASPAEKPVSHYEPGTHARNQPFHEEEASPVREETERRPNELPTAAQRQAAPPTAGPHSKNQPFEGMNPATHEAVPAEQHQAAPAEPHREAAPEQKKEQSEEKRGEENGEHHEP